MNTRWFWLRVAATAALSLLPLPGMVRAAPEYESSEVMVPMRDGIKLHTVLVRPKGAARPLPILFQRTPYNVPARAGVAHGRLPGAGRRRIHLRLPGHPGEVRVGGDVRHERPARDAADPKGIDEGTDAYDTIDWLIKNVAGNNGRVGMFGVSYDGWTTVMALLEPHPALSAASPQASPADMFLGDDFHHNGAFRLSYGFEYVARMEWTKEFSPSSSTATTPTSGSWPSVRSRPPTPDISTTSCRPGTTSSTTPTTIVLARQAVARWAAPASRP